MPDGRASIITLILRRALILIISISYGGVSCVQAAPLLSNQASPLGVGLNGVSYFSSEQPFLNIFKTGSGWITQNSKGVTHEEAKLVLDANGYPTSLTTGSGGQMVDYTSVSQPLLRDLPSPYYPRGRYLLLYDGEGDVEYQFDAKKNIALSKPGRDVLDVNPSRAGIFVNIKKTDPNHVGNYVRNIRLVRADQEVLLNSGEVFNPALIDRLAPFRNVRFMDWMHTNDSPQSTWEDRPVPDKAFYGDSNGVPLEVMVALSNKLNTDVWFNMPHMATDDYVAKFATFAYRSLAYKQRVYVEYSNETWNGIFKQTGYITTQGRARWPFTRSDVSVNRSFYGMRTSQICEMWKRVWGADASRVVCIMGTQTANYGVATASLDCSLWERAPCSTNHGIDALAITGYIGGSIPSSWSSQEDGGLGYLFTQILQGGIDPKGYPGGFIKQFNDLTTANKKIADAHGLELVFYEGGWGFVAPGDAGLTALFIRANRDPRMGQVYTALLEAWKKSGGHIFNQFVDVSTYTKWGSWGALENVMLSNSPKYDALINFIAVNPCWWSNCAR